MVKIVKRSRFGDGVSKPLTSVAFTLSLLLGGLSPGAEGPLEGAEGPKDMRGSEPLGGGRLPPNEAGRSSRGGPAGGMPGIPGRPVGN